MDAVSSSTRTATSSSGGKTVDERVAEKLEEFAPYMDGLSGARRALVWDSLRDYCHVAVQLEDVDEAVERDGTTVTSPTGHVSKNPDLNVQHSLRTEKNALLPKLIKYLPDDGDEDALEAFMRAGGE